MLTHGAFSEKWNTLQPPDPQPLTSPFQTAFLRLSEPDKFIPLVRKQSPLFFCLIDQWKEEGGSRTEGGRNTSAWQYYTVGTWLMCCVLGLLGLGVWAPLSYNKIDKKPRAQPSGNLRGRVSRPGGQESGKEGQNSSGTTYLCWPVYIYMHKFVQHKFVDNGRTPSYHPHVAPISKINRFSVITVQTWRLSLQVLLKKNRTQWEDIIKSTSAGREGDGVL